MKMSDLVLECLQLGDVRNRPTPGHKHKSSRASFTEVALCGDRVRCPLGQANEGTNMVKG